MCRMLAAPNGIPARTIGVPFLRMARGENALNEKNTRLGLVRHGDGWGAVLETAGGLEHVRSARPCWDDPAFAQSDSVRVRLLHARLASVAGLGEAHAHPYSEESLGATWYFCHNGTLRDEPDDGTGDTDSKRYFRRMAKQLESQDPVAAFEAAASILRDVTALNALLLGPEGLWAFCAWAGANCRAYYTLVWAETADGVVVSSEPLRDVAEHWTPMENGTALIATARAGVRIVRLRLPFLSTPAAA